MLTGPLTFEGLFCLIFIWWICQTIDWEEVGTSGLLIFIGFCCSIHQFGLFISIFIFFLASIAISFAHNLSKIMCSNYNHLKTLVSTHFDDSVFTFIVCIMTVLIGSMILVTNCM